MNILLINDNPVVNKLVTLSAQKTSDTLEVVESLDALESASYDLVVIDDTLYSDELYMELNEKIQYSKSLYICSRDAQEVSTFTKILKKPFLPTDLVELFSIFSKESDEIDLSALDELDTNEEFPAEEELDLSVDKLEDDLNLDELNLDDLENLDELNLDDLESDSILDDDEAQKVKDLLKETEATKEELEPEVEEELALEEEEPEVEEELALEEEEPEVDIGIAEQIENAVENLSEEDLESEIDESTLLDIVSGDLDSLTSRDIKLAVGENVEELEEIVEKEEVQHIIEESTEENSGVEALKNLLNALNDKNVAASMKGMKITINITLGDS